MRRSEFACDLVRRLPIKFLVCERRFFLLSYLLKPDERDVRLVQLRLQLSNFGAVVVFRT